MNQFYYPAENMKNTVDSLKAKAHDMSTLRWGDYHHKLADPESWPRRPPCPPGLNWDYFKNKARDGLSRLANSSPLSQDEPDVVPSTRCDLLDLAVRKCFNSVPPIPILLDVMDKDEHSVNPDEHDVTLVWEYGQNGTPTLLRFTMHCPRSGAPRPGT